ncbi:MAG: hypothetical protein A2X02_06785 [Bacteroidetes bacterium GWF2_29_10]|nr:MAG: hypothetical protein A2X02_06785 [Bacteroidetes bacterium GWF2_29_10]
MIKELQVALQIEDPLNEDSLKQYAAKALKIDVSKIDNAKIIKKSVDARQKIPKVNLTILIYDNSEKIEERKSLKFEDVSDSKPIHIIGAGPAGLFAAIRLIEKGLKPIIFERGKDVSNRKIDIANIYKNKEVDPESNYCFGEGGAGAFSDGKLYTRSNKRGDINYILSNLVDNGADENILYESHAHIGSDKLPTIIKSIREKIIEAGGEIHFESKLDDLFIEAERIIAISINKTRIPIDKLILATGHSANDVYYLLEKHKIQFEAKPLAIGVRVEHLQEYINDVRYHGNYNPQYLEPATYSLVEQVDNRAVFSFCMCPGGSIIPSLTETDQLVVNGMSNSKRNGEYANSGIVVSVNLDDIQSYIEKYGQMGMLLFRDKIEQTFREHANNNLIAPAQNIKDFVYKKKSTKLYDNSYIPGVISLDFNELLPEFITNALREGLKLFNAKFNGFIEEGIIIGAETRTSSPIRINRDNDTFQHVQINNLYPCGEGAGYAGGITSSAIDGVNCANKISLKETIS